MTSLPWRLAPDAVRRSVAACALPLLLTACAQVPPQGQASAAAGAMAYALAGPVQAPAVVLQSGLGDGRATWNVLWPRLTASHRVFAADRPGYADSPASTAPRDPCQVARELRTALADAQVPPPYLLVGHSLGGLYQEVFARRYPGDTAGLLLLDPTHPDHWAALQREAPESAALLGGLRATLFTPVMRAEFDAQARCVDTLPPLPARLPVRLLFSGQHGPLEGDAYRRMLERLRRDTQARLHATTETVAASGHYLHRDAPDRVAGAIDQMIAARATGR